jgi:hypothetical protein
MTFLVLIYLLIDKFINKIEIVVGKGKDANNVEWMLYKMKKLENKTLRRY